MAMLQLTGISSYCSDLFLFPIIENGEECCMVVFYAWFSFRSFFASHASKKSLFSRDSKGFKKNPKICPSVEKNFLNLIFEQRKLIFHVYFSASIAIKFL